MGEETGESRGTGSANIGGMMRAFMCELCLIGFTESHAADENFICPACGGHIERTEHIGIPKEG